MNSATASVENIGNNSTVANRQKAKTDAPLVPESFRPIGDLAAAYLDRIERNAYRQMAGHELIDAVLKCGPDAPRFLEIIHATLSPGHPIPNPLGLMAEAQEWAEWASTAERKAYALACFAALTGADQAAFLSHVGARAAA